MSSPAAMGPFRNVEQQFIKQRVAFEDVAAFHGQRFDIGSDNAVDEHRQRHYQTCDGSGGTDVEKRITRANAAAHVDYGAQRAKDHEGQRNEVGRRNFDPMNSPGDVMAELVRKQNRHHGQRKWKAFEKPRNGARFVTFHLGADPEHGQECQYK